MNKNKPFVFVAVLVILFIMGNWVTSAQATSASVIAATPMPTGTPISTPVVPPGEIPSLEEQDKIKSVIQAYFDIRYRALSVSDANDFKQNGFGDLISDTPEAKAFLRDELGKLAVEIKHAELNRLRYVDYKYSLEFGNISVVMPSQNAVVSATEQNEVTYELSKELRPEEPIVSQHANIEHVIVLRNEQGKWRIISDDYNDYLWKMLRQSGKSTEEILRTMKASSDASIQRNTIMSTSTLSADSSTHSYDRAGAVDYARKYWETYNPDYYDYKNDGGDCTNFISQAIYEGGNASMSIPAVLPPPSTGGDTNWYYLDYLHRARAWNFVDAFYEFATTRGWGEGPQGYQVNTLDELLPGDIIQYDWEGNGSWDHSVIVVDKVGGYPYVDSHTPDKEHELYTAFSDYNPNVSQIRFIHIEQSDGYPPVKATIEQEPGDQAGKSSNDAGTNPLNSCSFSLDGPEIYFGLCPDGSSSSGGFRFKNIPIPHGTVIKYAYLTFTVDGPYSSPLDINIYGENAPDSAPFTDTNQPKDRSLIGPIPWPITDTWQIGQRRTTPNLSPIMNVIVGNGWQYGNSLSFIFKDPGPNTGLRRVVTFDRASWDIQYGPLFPAKLIAAYEIQDENPSNTHPRVSSVIRAENFTSPTKSPTVNFTVTFTEPVTGVDITDFKLTEIPEEGNTIAEYSVTDVSPINNPPGTYNDTYNVIVNTGTGDGVIRLDVLDDNTIVDADSNPLNGGFITGESFVIDKTAPFAFFIGILPPSVNPTNAASVDFWVYFNEPVVGVDTVGPTFDDFSLQIDGVTGASIASVARVRGDQYYVIVNTGNGNGTISLKLENSGAIRDYATNPLHVFGSSTSEPYTINKDAPTVLSSLRASANPTDATNANFTITFSETVTGVDASDFALTTSGISGATITSVSGSGNTYTATVNTGSGDGTIRLDIVDDDTIVDEDGNPLGIIGLGNGNFSAGEAYNVVKTVPIVVSIVRSSINPTSYYNVKYTVTFSKSVTGVDLSDFILTATGVSGATISGVSGSGKSYTVTINTGSGSGTIRLDVIDDDSIHESIPLGGTGIGNGNFTSGETYNVDKTAISSTVSKSADTNDGFCDSDCSLREALATAAPGDTITFDSALSGGTIRVTSTLTISRNITIDGSALAVTITISGDTNNNGTGDVQVLMVNSGVIANLNNLTIAKSKFYGVKNYGTLTVTNSTFTGNGGGIYNYGGLLTVTNSAFSNNSSTYGGGIYNKGGTLTVMSSTFSGNYASYQGGGIYNRDDGIATVTNSTFSGNYVRDEGGGISIDSGTLTVSNSTFSGNYSTYYPSAGGGVEIGNSATLNYANTIIANSTNSKDCVNYGTIGTNINNLVEDGGCTASLTGDPNLGALADNGGSTQTMELLAGSPAIDAGDDGSCPATDQRGVSRPQGAHCDIGAYEYEMENSAPTDITISASSVTENLPASTTVGTLTTTDSDAGDTHTYSFCGGADDASFQISDNQLQTNTIFDYEIKNSYSVCIRSTDSSGLHTDKTFPITVTNANETPTNIVLSNNSIAENQVVGTLVGNLSSTDPDAGDTFAYAFCGGTNDTSFQISGSELQTNAVFNYEVKGSYSVCVRSTDFAGLHVDETFSIAVTNINETPTNIALSNSSIAENQPVGSLIGNLSSADPDAGDTFAYSFCGGADDGSFSILSNTLNSAAVFDFEMKNSYNICLRTDDGNGGAFDKAFTITVMDVNETLTATFRSVRNYDGWILESAENSNAGGTLDKTAATFNLGDDEADKQYRAILHFNTATLPDTAVITKVTLKIKKQGLVGTNPFTILGGLKVDMRKPFFGANAGLVIGDFQAAAGKSAVATFSATPVSNWYSALLNATGRAYVNLTGTTQFRLRFVTGDNDDNGADYMKFFSGNTATASARPTLIIEYYVP